MKHKVYKITNILDEKFYIGVTKDTLEARFKQHSIKDSYVGNAIRKYGIENFKIEEIYSFESKEESYNQEAEIVDEAFLKRDDTYNQKLGGEGGWDYVNSEGLNNLDPNNTRWSEERNKKISETMTKQFINGRESSFVKLHRDGKMKYDNFAGKHHTVETKKQMRESHKGKHDGSKNSQFGTMWIHNIEEKISMKIKSVELPDFEEKGWFKGKYKVICDVCGRKITEAILNNHKKSKTCIKHMEI